MICYVVHLELETAMYNETGQQQTNKGDHLEYNHNASGLSTHNHNSTETCLSSSHPATLCLHNTKVCLFTIDHIAIVSDRPETATSGLVDVTRRSLHIVIAPMFGKSR